MASFRFRQSGSSLHTLLGSDKVLLAELSLYGSFHLLPDVLMYRRCHAAQSSLLSVASKSLWSGTGRRREHWLSLRLRKVIPGYLDVVTDAPIGLGQELLCYAAVGYRLVAPQTWIKHFQPGRYTETFCPVPRRGRLAGSPCADLSAEIAICGIKEILSE